MFELIDVEPADAPGARLMVIGVGGGGGNAVDNMVVAGLHGVDVAVANTDVQALGRSQAPKRIHIGAKVTRGLGAGARPETGQRAALEDEKALREALAGADMVFVTAGMGGGTGTGAAPVVARIAREIGALTVGVVTKPFRFEGRQRARRAEQGVADLSEAVDTLIVIPNDRLLEIAGAETSFVDAFRLADSVLLDAVRSMTDIIQTPGLVNVDFADVVTVMRRSGLALMGTGRGAGPARARDAAFAAISSPLLEGAALDHATGLLVNITGGPDMTLREIDEAMSLIQDAVHEETETIFGAVIDPQLGAELRITVVATGFGQAPLHLDHEPGPPPSRSHDRHDRHGDRGTGRHALPPSGPGRITAPQHGMPGAAGLPAQASTTGTMPVAVADAEELVLTAPIGPPPRAEALAPPVFAVGGRPALEAPPQPSLPGLLVSTAQPMAVAAQPQQATASLAAAAEPAFVRTAAQRVTPPGFRRQPVMNTNPFAEARDFPDLEAPAFIRNR